MSGIPYPTGAIVNTTIVSATVANVVNNLKDELVNAGWTVVASAVDDFTLESGTTPQGLKCRVRVFADTLSAKVSFRDQSETRVGINHFLRAGIGSFRVIACQYQFWVLLPGSSTTGNSFVAGGVPYVEQSFIWESIWSQGNGNTDGDISPKATFRTVPYCKADTGQVAAHTWVSFNGFARNGASTPVNNDQGDQQLLVPMRQGSADPGYQTIGVWYSEAGVGADPLSTPARICWAVPSFADYPSVRGTLWGTLVTTGAPSVIDETVTGQLDGKDWYAITDPAGDPSHDNRGNGHVWTIIGN